MPACTAVVTNKLTYLVKPIFGGWVWGRVLFGTSIITHTEEFGTRFRITTYRPEFLDGVIDLWKKCDLVVPQNDPVEDIKKKIEFQPELFFVGLSDSNVVGSIMVGYDGHRGWIYYLAVAPEYQRQGYGKELVQKGVDELRKMGCLKVNLQVRNSNTAVISFYKHLGFKDDSVTSLGFRLKKQC